MTYSADGFRAYFLAQGHKETSCNSYLVNLKKIDSAVKDNGNLGLDEAIEREIEWLLKWARTSSDHPFDKETSNRRSALKKYLTFRESTGEVELDGLADDAAEEIPLEPVGQAFHLERDMQLAVRRQLESLEVGLKAIDQHVERKVSTGEIDITAKDVDGNFVLIELKAGDCPKGALEQLLGYANDVRIEEGVQRVRMFLISRSFSDRIVGAASFVPDLKLVTYDFSLSFKYLDG